MKFIEEENSFELSVVGYQFPDAKSEDSNWLVIQLNFSDARGAWGVADPCLLTYEASHLADWFDQLNSENFENRECGFIEPVISFSVVNRDQQRFLRIHLALEALPAWAQDQDEYFVELALSRIDLKSATDDLRKQLETYPQRAAR